MTRIVSTFRWLAVFLACAMTPANAAALAPELVAKIRAGGVLASDPRKTYRLPLQGSATLPLVEVRVNGKGPFLLLVDFGSNVLLLRPDAAKAAGVEMLVVREGADIARARRLELPDGLEFGDVHFGVDEGLRDVAGVIGFNVFRFGNVSWHGAKRTLVVNADIALDVATGAVPMKLESRMPYVNVASGETRFWANLDTGARGWFTVPPGVADTLEWRAPFTEGPRLYNNQYGHTNVSVGEFRHGLNIGDAAFSGFKVYVNPDADTPWFGMSFLRHCRFDLDLDSNLARFDCDSDAIGRLVEE